MTKALKDYSVGQHLFIVTVLLTIVGSAVAMVYLEWPSAPQENIGKAAYNEINGVRRGQIVGVQERLGAMVYVIRTEDGAMTYAPVDGTEVR